LGGAKQVNEVKFAVTGARKIYIEGCKTTNASEFKKVGESKGKFHYLMLEQTWQTSKAASYQIASD
jgi:hypothetical protein